MKLRLTLIALALELFVPVLSSAQTIEPYFVKGNRLSYKGYTVTRSYNSATSVDVAVIRKNGRTLASMKQSDNYHASTRMGLVALLGGKTKQLVIEQSSGGNKCCFYYRIYDLYPRFRLLFDSEKYPVGHDRMELINLDNDKRKEFTLDSLTVTFTEWLLFITSPRPTIIFRYDLHAQKYVPANFRYAAYCLKGVAEEINKIKQYNKEIDKTSSEGDNFQMGVYLSYILDVFFTYVYAGKERQAWFYYDKLYRLNNKRASRTQLRNLLRKDAIYQALYRAQPSG